MIILQDLFYSQRDFENGEEIRRLYCLHAVNHIFKYVSLKLLITFANNVDISIQSDLDVSRPCF